MTEPYHADNLVTVHHGDCLQHLRNMPDNSIDSIVTDPPYGLSNTGPGNVADTIVRWAGGERDHVPEGRGFMGRSWDAFVPPPAVWDECLRVLKPGGHMLVFAGSRTQDLMGLSIRLAGFELRDSLAWIYGSGMPKSLDVSKAIDKRGGNPDLAQQIAAAIKSARESRGWTAGRADKHFCGGTTNWTWFEGRKGECRPPTPETFARIVAEWPELAEWAGKVAEAEREVIGKNAWTNSANHFVPGEDHTQRVHTDVTAPATPEAERWAGWGTSLKPAIEPILCARKPLEGTVAGNVLEWGTGALNIDASRVAMSDGDREVVDNRSGAAADYDGEGWGKRGNYSEGRKFKSAPAGRWPANVLLDPEAAAAMDQQSGVSTSTKRLGRYSPTTPTGNGVTHGKMNGLQTDRGVEDSGGASRFFHVFKYQAKAPKKERPVIERPDGTKVQHPTVKPLALMEWLVTLITPPGGVVLDPFAGSGTTLQAARDKGFRAIGVEADADHCELIVARLSKDDGGLFAA